MSNADREAGRARLQEKWPRWDIWWVPHALDGSATWCARIKGDEIKNVVTADSPEHLDQHIQFREEDLAADARLSDEAAQDMDGDTRREET